MTATTSRTTSRVGGGRGLERYRRNQQALAIAAEAAAEGAGVSVGDIEAVLAERGWNHAIPDRPAMALAAQNEWWHRILARVDAGLDDDLAAVPPAARYAAVRSAWEAQRRETPTYLILASLGEEETEYQANERRFARLLALFAGTADVTDDFDTAATAGLRLVQDLTSGPG